MQLDIETWQWECRQCKCFFSRKPLPCKKTALNMIDTIRGKPMSREDRIKKTFELTAALIEASQFEKTRQDKKHEAWFARMMEDPQGRLFISAMTDQCFRSQNPRRIANQLIYLMKKYGIPSFLNESERIKFLSFKLFGQYLPEIFVPALKKQIGKEMAAVLLPEDIKKQAAYFEYCRREDIRINLNHLGEAILGENEAHKRLKRYLDDLANPSIEYISIKISTIYSQINMIGFKSSLNLLKERLRTLYRAAKTHSFSRKDGSKVGKFVNLDMEEYKDLELTFTLFQEVLSEEEFINTYAGIVLQTYLPDSFNLQKILTKWAISRLQLGGAPIKLRLVKGANLAMEKVEGSMRGWEQAPFSTKVEVDANFKKMLEYACHPHHAEAVHIGVGSHNLFDIAYVLLLRAENQVENYVSFEMLEGMAIPMRRVVKKLANGILIYCPEAREKDFVHAIAYLLRRLDENCGSENFLRHFYHIQPHNHFWLAETERFKEACRKIESISESPRRQQNRWAPPQKPKQKEHFNNEPDTDFALKNNRNWAEHIYATWREKKHDIVPLSIEGDELFTVYESGIDPSNPFKPLFKYSLADIDLIERALSYAEKETSKWRLLSPDERDAILEQVAQHFRERRHDLIGAMIANTGKTILEADPEVSEAVDFIEYYRKNWAAFRGFSDLKWMPKGIVLVAPPWNFPCSIPVSGIAAALVAGNHVLFKPAPEAVLVGWYVARAFWDAGVPKEALQFIPCKENPIGNYLIKHPKVASIILTGGTKTAQKFIKMRPGIDLHAETGGKNAIIVTAMSDRDQAIRDIIASAFGHSGQKCSACSLAILEAEVFDDPNFRDQLLDACSSLKIGSAWEMDTKITPLIKPPQEHLYKGLTEIETGESWLLQPKPDRDNPHLWSPGIKWGVRKKSFTHMHELFGPVLGVMRAENLEHAIDLVNSTPYGLTSGLHSLDEREHTIWQSKIIAGNLYINRGITGAIVSRQPFGGTKLSHFGLGAKAGGPNYVQQFASVSQIDDAKEKAPLPSSLIPLFKDLDRFGLNEQQQHLLKSSAENYAYWAPILKKPIDPSSVLGQDNDFYLVPLDKAYVRLNLENEFLSLLQVVSACLICQTPLEISSLISLPKFKTLTGIFVVVEEEDLFFKKGAKRIRLLSKPTEQFTQKAAESGSILLDRPVLSNGRIELLHYLREISLSFEYHRYGYLGSREAIFQ